MLNASYSTWSTCLAFILTKHVVSFQWRRSVKCFRRHAWMMHIDIFIKKLGFYIAWSEGRGLLSLAVTLVHGERAEQGKPNCHLCNGNADQSKKKKKKKKWHSRQELHPFKGAIKVRSTANTPLIIIHPGHLLWKPAAKRWKHQMFLKVKCVKKSDVTLIGCG